MSESSLPKTATASYRRVQDRRDAPRIRTICRAGTVRTQWERGFCRFYNISDGGALIQTSIDVATGSWIEVELSPNHRFAAEVIWRRDGKAGLRFERKIDCCSVIRALAHDHWNGT